MEKVGIVDAGGGFRGVYACGALDRCLEEGVSFDLCIGVSAGSANLASFIAGQMGRNYRFYTHYGMRKKYASLGNYVRHGSFLGLDYIYSTLSNADGEDPLDYAAMKANPADFIVVAADARTGDVRYFTKEDMHKDDYDILKASCAIPGVCRPYEIDGIPYFDGALGDPVPVERAFAEGCDRVVVLLTKPANVARTPGQDPTFARMVRRKYPHAATALLNRAERYNEGVRIAREYERAGRALIVSPDDTCGVSTLTRDKDRLDALYAKGYGDGEQIVSFLN